MRGEMTIDLGAVFRYPNGKGEYMETSIVTVRAPGLSQFHVQTKMQSFVMEAMFGLARKSAEVKGAEQARKEAAAEEDDDAPDAEVEPDGEVIMQQVAIGLGVDTYPEFALYVKKVLTNSKLASVGEGDSSARITDETWDAIEQACGTEAALRILGTFAHFFRSSGRSRKPSGSVSSTTSSLPMKAPSTPNGPSKRPLRN